MALALCFHFGWRRRCLRLDRVLQRGSKRRWRWILAGDRLDDVAIARGATSRHHLNRSAALLPARRICSVVAALYTAVGCLVAAAPATRPAASTAYDAHTRPPSAAALFQSLRRSIQAVGTRKNASPPPPPTKIAAGPRALSPSPARASRPQRQDRTRPAKHEPRYAATHLADLREPRRARSLHPSNTAVPSPSWLLSASRFSLSWCCCLPFTQRPRKVPAIPVFQRYFNGISTVYIPMHYRPK